MNVPVYLLFLSFLSSLSKGPCPLFTIGLNILFSTAADPVHSFQNVFGTNWCMYFNFFLWNEVAVEENNLGIPQVSADGCIQDTNAGSWTRCLPPTRFEQQNMHVHIHCVVPDLLSLATPDSLHNDYSLFPALCCQLEAMPFPTYNEHPCLLQQKAAQGRWSMQSAFREGGSSCRAVPIHYHRGSKGRP